jgi:protein-disulfide isomerase
MFNRKGKNFFNNFSSQTSFWFGLIIGVLLLCSIGFFILLGSLIDNNRTGDSRAVNGNNNLNQAANLNQAPSAGAANLKPLTDQDHIRGDLNAPVVMVEFSDYQCPYCAQAWVTLQQLVDDYQGKVAWVHKHLPLDSLHSYARAAAEAAECAADQGKFWEYTDSLYANQDLISPDYLKSLAGELGLNLSQFIDCQTSGKYQQRVKDNEQEALAAGINGTPGIYFNDILIKGARPYNDFKQVIDSLLK